MLENSIRYALIQKEIIIVVFIDLSSAYDHVNHTALLYKLQKYSVRGRILRYVRESLNNCFFSVIFEGNQSEKRPIKTGLAQGSVLSPLLFNVMMSDVPETPGVAALSYADDIAFSCSGPCIEEIIENIQLHLDKFSDWCNNWGLKINVSKTKSMIFTKKKVQPIMLRIYEQPIEYVKKFKYLGMTLDAPNLCWNDHIRELENKTASNTNVLQAISGKYWGADRSTLLDIYTALIRSKLDYGSIFYDFSSETQLKKLNKIQNKCLRIAIGAQRTSPIFSIEVESHIMPLNLHRKLLLPKYFFRIMELPRRTSIIMEIVETMQSLWNKTYSKVTQKPLCVRAYEAIYELNLNHVKFKHIPLITPLRPTVDREELFREDFGASPINSLSDDLVMQTFNFLKNEEFPNSLEIYTDGSLIMSPESSSSGSFIIKSTLSESSYMTNFKLPKEFSILSCKLYAMKAALDYVITHELFNQPIVLFTKSKSSISALKNPISGT